MITRKLRVKRYLRVVKSGATNLPMNPLCRPRENSTIRKSCSSEREHKADSPT